MLMADVANMDFVHGMKDMLGMDEDRVKDLIDRLDADAMMTLTDALANNDKPGVERIVSTIDTDEEVNPLFRGQNIDDKVRKKKHRRKVAPNYEYKYGDDVHVRMTDPDTGTVGYEDGTVYLPSGPDDTIGVKVQGKSRMVDRKKVRPLKEGSLDEGVLGMVGIPDLERMQQLAGIHPPAEIAVQPTASEPATDPCTAAQQAMQALDVVAEMLPNVRLVDLKAIRQRIITLQTAMNESAP
jgi:hypothetical protein